jgi:cell division septation protein DedD
MGSIKRSLLALLFLAPALYGQDRGIPIGTEIQNLEQKSKMPSISNAERHDTQARLALLHELSGNFEKAAEAWIASASADPGKRDDMSLIRGARCFAATGEWEKAGAAVRTVLLSSGDARASLEARLLGSQIEAFLSGNSSVLAGLLDDPGFAGTRAAILYTLWNTTGLESWKTRLLAEYPRSPEGRAAEAQTTVHIKPSALWLLFPGRSGFTLETAPSAALPAPPAAPSVAASPPASSGAMLQTGLYGREENARRQADKLRAAGFSPVMVKRTVNENEYWAVQVSPESDLNRVVLKLKEAGFESFPVF